MSTEVTKFDPATYVDKVRDKIKQSLIDVIPDEQWNAMLKAEISGFFEHRTNRDQWGGTTTTMSEFHRIAKLVLEEETKKRLRDMLNGPDWTSYWDGNKQQAGEEIAKLARDNGAAILAKWLESAISQVISSIRFNNNNQ
jgi:hypothetical protein